MEKVYETKNQDYFSLCTAFHRCCFSDRFFFSRKSEAVLREKATAFLTTVNVQKQSQIDQWLENVRYHIDLLRNRPLFDENIFLSDFRFYRDSSEEFINDPLHWVTENHLQPLVDKGIFDELYIMKIPDGEIMLSTSERQIGKVMEQKPYFIEGQKMMAVQSVYYSMSLMQPTMVISAPLVTHDNEVYGVLAGRLNLKALSDIVQKQSGFWDSEDTYLVNKQNFFITEPHFGDNYMLRKTNTTFGVEEALKGNSGTADYIDYREVPVISSYMYLPDHHLALITEIDRQEFIAPVNSMKRSLLFIACIVVALAVFCGSWVATSLLKPLENLVDKLGGLHSGNMELNKPVERLSEEIRRIYEAFELVLERLSTTLVSRDLLIKEVEQRKDAQKRLKKALLRVRQSNKELEQFAYVASHDLQEPLRMVSSYNQLLADRYKGQLDEKADKYIYYAVDGATRMQILIQNLLQYSRVTTRGKEFEIADCHDLLAMAVKNLEITIRENAALVTNDELPEIRCDGGQITQVFQNLIANGIKFQGEHPPAVHVGAEKVEDMWRFSITDNGIGIDEKYAERIFQIFQRLHTRKDYEGTGIGLALCKRIVERHGGAIWFTSAVGEGTTFYFSIPENAALETVPGEDMLSNTEGDE